MRTIMAALTDMGLTAEAAEVREVWGNYLALRGATKPQDYDVCYPDELLQALAADVRAGYEALGLRLFVQQGSASSEINIPRLLETAWDKVRSEPAAYANWEAERLHELRSMLS